MEIHFKTHKEIFLHLINGGSVCHPSAPRHEMFINCDGMLFDVADSNAGTPTHDGFPLMDDRPELFYYQSKDTHGSQTRESKEKSYDMSFFK